MKQGSEEPNGGVSERGCFRGLVTCMSHSPSKCIVADLRILRVSLTSFTKLSKNPSCSLGLLAKAPKLDSE
jgi:hypothetical protein